MKCPPAMLKFFAEFINKELGIVYQEANFYQLDTRLAEIAGLSGLSSPEDLYQLAVRGLTPQLKGLVLDIATNNETYFFRDPTLFEAIEQTVIPGHRAGGATGPFRVWSAACSFGQEIYSLAMLFDKHQAQLTHGYSIVATDVSQRALKAASLGVYSELQAQRGLSPALLNKYFEKVAGDSGEWRVRSELKRNLKFQEQNLLSSFESLGRFHFILCRNVLIYQTVERKKEILSRLHRQLEPGGYLVLGSAESLIGISDDFEMERTAKATLYRRLAPVAKAS